MFMVEPLTKISLMFMTVEGQPLFPLMSLLRGADPVPYSWDVEHMQMRTDVKAPNPLSGIWTNDQISSTYQQKVCPLRY